nr:MAG TPA: hypothetical protein [Caudoviricetes sp.]
MKINKAEFYKTELGVKTDACIKGLEMHLEIINRQGYLKYLEMLDSSELWLSNATELYRRLRCCMSTIEKFYSVKTQLLQYGDKLLIMVTGNGEYFLTGGLA